jgi:hypothetical protein
MGLGKMIKIAFTSEIKCDNCGRVIVDGTGKTGRFNSAGKLLPNSVGMEGVGLINTLVYGSKKKNLCSMCKALEKSHKKIDEAVAAEEAKYAEEIALEKENLRLQNDLLKKQLANESMPTMSRSAPNVSSSLPKAKKAAKFCSDCGSALKPNSRFCIKCGQAIR